MRLNELEKYFYNLQGDPEKTKVFKDIKSGDIVSIYERILDEKKKERIQKFNGIVIRKRGSYLRENILLREKLKNHWVEKSYFIHSPLVKGIEKIREGRSRRAYLSYLRNPEELPIKLKRLKSKNLMENSKENK